MDFVISSITTGYWNILVYRGHFQFRDSCMHMCVCLCMCVLTNPRTRVTHYCVVVDLSLFWTLVCVVHIFRKSVLIFDAVTYITLHVVSGDASMLPLILEQMLQNFKETTSGVL